MGKTYTDYEEWLKVCRELKLDGPKQVAGYRSYEFIDESGQAALWANGVGTVSREPIKPVLKPHVIQPETPHV
jgi:hypothetical protein